VIRQSILEKENFYNLRIFAVFDENEWDTRFIKTNIRHYINKKPIQIYQNKNMDFFYIPDLVKLVEYYVTNNDLPKEANCHYGNTVSLKDIANLINNLDRVCGSREFSEIMVKSYLSKHEFKYSLDSISSIILWKDSRSYDKYKDYFLSRYENCMVLDDDQILLNFEGINKFLLNINEEHVENFEVKEQINDMYYNCMTELISSFEKLYKNK
jgi:nucleoside-diphosphate-sugar epimerase